MTTNRKAYFNYHIEENLSAGIVLKGSEIKSIRDGKIDISQAFRSNSGLMKKLLRPEFEKYPPPTKYLVINRGDISQTYPLIGEARSGILGSVTRATKELSPANTQT